MHFVCYLRFISISFQIHYFVQITISRLSIIKASMANYKIYSQFGVTHELFIVDGRFILLCICLSSSIKSMLSTELSEYHCLVNYNYFLFIINMNSLLICLKKYLHSNPPIGLFLKFTSASSLLSYFCHLSSLFLHPRKSHQTQASPISVWWTFSTHPNWMRSHTVLFSLMSSYMLKLISILNSNAALCRTLIFMAAYYSKVMAYLMDRKVIVDATRLLIIVTLFAFIASSAHIHRPSCQSHRFFMIAYLLNCFQSNHSSHFSAKNPHYQNYRNRNPLTLCFILFYLLFS